MDVHIGFQRENALSRNVVKTYMTLKSFQTKFRRDESHLSRYNDKIHEISSKARPPFCKRTSTKLSQRAEDNHEYIRAPNHKMTYTLNINEFMVNAKKNRKRRRRKICQTQSIMPMVNKKCTEDIMNSSKVDDFTKDFLVKDESQRDPEVEYGICVSDQECDQPVTKTSELMCFCNFGDFNSKNHMLKINACDKNASLGQLERDLDTSLLPVERLISNIKFSIESSPKKWVSFANRELIQMLLLSKNIKINGIRSWKDFPFSAGQSSCRDKKILDEIPPFFNPNDSLMHIIAKDKNVVRNNELNYVTSIDLKQNPTGKIVELLTIDTLNGEKINNVLPEENNAEQEYTIEWKAKSKSYCCFKYIEPNHDQQENYFFLRSILNGLGKQFLTSDDLNVQRHERFQESLDKMNYYFPSRRLT